MNSILKKILIILGILVIISFVILYSGMYYISGQLNKSFANKEINIEPLLKTQYIIKFDNISPFVSPLDIGFKVQGYIEDNLESRIEYKCPIYIGYNLKQNNFYLTFSGEILGLFKPLASGFGVKILSEKNSMEFNLPIGLSFIKALFSSEIDKIELVNNLKGGSLSNKKIEVFDLVDKEKIFEETKSTFNFSIAKHKYWHNINELLDNIPQNINIDFEHDITHSSHIKKIFPINLLLGFRLPFKLYIKSNAVFNTKYDKWEEAKDNHSIAFNNIITKSDVHEDVSNYKQELQLQGGKETSTLRYKSALTIKEGFAKQTTQLCKVITEMMKSGSSNMLYQLYGNVLENFLKQVENLKNLENKNYDIIADLESAVTDNEIKIKINELSIISNTQSGFKIKGDCEGGNISNINMMNLPSLNVAGNIEIFNYFPVANFFAENIYSLLGVYGYDKLKYDIDSKSIISALLIISDNRSLQPLPNVNIKLNIDSNNIEKAEIGNVDYDRFFKLYKLEKYLQLANRIENSTDKTKEFENLCNIITPEEKTLLEQLIKDPTSINMDTILNNIK